MEVSVLLNPVFLPVLLSLSLMALDAIVDPVEIATDLLLESLPVIALLMVAVVVISALLVRHFRKK